MRSLVVSFFPHNGTDTRNYAEIVLFCFSGKEREGEREREREKEREVIFLST